MTLLTITSYLTSIKYYWVYKTHISNIRLSKHLNIFEVINNTNITFTAPSLGKRTLN